MVSPCFVENSAATGLFSPLLWQIALVSLLWQIASAFQHVLLLHCLWARDALFATWHVLLGAAVARDAFRLAGS